MTRRGQRLAVLFMLAGIALNYPLLSLLGADGRIAGVPVLYAYLFSVWAIVIASVAVGVERRGREG